MVARRKPLYDRHGDMELHSLAWLEMAETWLHMAKTGGLDLSSVMQAIALHAWRHGAAKLGMVGYHYSYNWWAGIVGLDRH